MSVRAVTKTLREISERNSIVDVVVIGGGIVGAGVARDATMRGLSVVLCEQNDFAAGTSSRSTRLLHGGIRYLAQGRLKLVREANREKTVILRIAPHISQATPFVFPAVRGRGFARWKLSLGVKLYDFLCGRRKLGRSKTLSVEETIRLAPGLSRQGLDGAVRYFDGFTNDARLVLDTLRSAANHGADVLNYTRFLSSTPSRDGWTCQLEERFGEGAFPLRARCLVNAAGPWSDRIPGAKTSLRLTKGVHLVIDRSRLPVHEAVVNVEGPRILFAIPWGERVILGTTDTDYRGPLDEPPCCAEDVDYVLGAINANFPEAHLKAADIISTWAGLRPLVAEKNGKPSDISRRHEITMSSPGWWDVTGGKLTTYRLMAEEAVDQMIAYLGADAPPCRTATACLVDAEGATPGSRILPPDVAPAVVRQACRQEWARRLDDVMLRRTSWGYYHRDHLQIAQFVAAWMQDELGWTDDRREAECRRYEELTTGPWQRRNGVPRESGSARGPAANSDAATAESPAAGTPLDR